MFLKALIALIAAVTLLAGGGVFAQEVIGVLTPLSGRHAALGEQIKTGAEFALAQRQEKTGAIRFTLKSADSACKGPQAQSGLNDLRAKDARIIIGPICSQSVLAVANEVTAAELPIITAYLRDARLDKGRADHGWPIYSLAQSASTEAQTIAKKIAKRWADMPFALLDDGSVYGRGLADDVRTLLEDDGIKPIALGNFRPLQTNQVALLRRMAKSGVEALFVAGDAEDVAVISRDAVNLSMNAEILGGETLVLLPHIDNLADVQDGLLALLPQAPEKMTAAQAIVTEMQAAGLTINGATLRGYVLAQIAMTALDEGTKPLVLKGPYPTIFGELTFDDSGRANALPLKLKVWREGKFQPFQAPETQ